MVGDQPSATDCEGIHCISVEPGFSICVAFTHDFTRLRDCHVAEELIRRCIWPNNRESENALRNRADNHEDLLERMQR